MVHVILTSILMSMGCVFADSHSDEAQRLLEQLPEIENQTTREYDFMHSSSEEVLFDVIKVGAESGDSDAQFLLAVMYDEGQGVEVDKKEAVKWYTKAAESGDSDAQNNLGAMYYLGDGIKENAELAKKWYTKAADQGNADAKHNLRAMRQENLMVYGIMIGIGVVVLLPIINRFRSRSKLEQRSSSSKKVE
jgi:TPR repeat protein